MRIVRGRGLGFDRSAGRGCFRGNGWKKIGRYVVYCIPLLIVEVGTTMIRIHEWKFLHESGMIAQRARSSIGADCNVEKQSISFC